MLAFLLARDTMHQNQWLAAIEELREEGAEKLPTPSNFPQSKEHTEVVNQYLNFSDGQRASEGRWASGPTPDGKGALTYHDGPTTSAPFLPSRIPTRGSTAPRSCPTPWRRWPASRRTRCTRSKPARTRHDVPTARWGSGNALTARRGPLADPLSLLRTHDRVGITGEGVTGACARSEVGGSEPAPEYSGLPGVGSGFHDSADAFDDSDADKHLPHRGRRSPSPHRGG